MKMMPAAQSLPWIKSARKAAAMRRPEPSWAGTRRRHTAIPVVTARFACCLRAGRGVAGARVNANVGRAMRVTGVCAVRSRGPRACVCARVQDGDLYCTPDLLSCIAAGCVPCAYKMVVQPSLPQGCEPLRFRANKRPEECLRMR